VSFREVMVVLVQVSPSHPYHIAHTERDLRACLPSAVQSVCMWTGTPDSIQGLGYVMLLCVEEYTYTRYELGSVLSVK
jgi:hypothetical protein